MSDEKMIYVITISLEGRDVPFRAFNELDDAIGCLKNLGKTYEKDGYKIITQDFDFILLFDQEKEFVCIDIYKIPVS
jgi:hypothetical protein